MRSKKNNKFESMASRLDVPIDVASSSNDYAQRFSGPVGEYFLETQINKVKKALGNYLKENLHNENKTVLKIGGGHCQLTQTYLDLGFKVTIQGSDERSFTRAYELGYDSNPNVKFVTCPIDKLNFKDNEFEIVSCFRIFAHISDWRKLASEMFRISNSGIIFDFANLETLNVLNPLLYKVKQSLEKNSRPFNCQSARVVKKYLYSIGIKEIEMYPQLILPMGLHRTIKKRAFSELIEKYSTRLGLSFLGNPVVTYAKK